jgi:hypothetical protein
MRSSTSRERVQRVSHSQLCACDGSVNVERVRGASCQQPGVIASRSTAFSLQSLTLSRLAFMQYRGRPVRRRDDVSRPLAPHNDVSRPLDPHNDVSRPWPLTMTVMLVLHTQVPS